MNTRWATSSQVDTREVKVHDQTVELTRKENLPRFMQNVGKVMTREVLLQKVWGYEYEGETRTVDIHCHLRRKLGPEGSPHRSPFTGNWRLT